MTSNMTKDELSKIRKIRIHKILQVPDNSRRISMACPIHNGRNPNFSLYPDNSYHCYKCGANGKGAIDLCKHLGYSFMESIKQLQLYL